MKNLIYTIAIFTVVINTTSCIQSKNTGSDEKAIIITLKKFYTEYIISIATPDSIPLSKGTDAIQKKYCTPNLINRIQKQFENEEIDADPFLKAQDTDIRFLETLSVKKDSTRLNDFIVSYECSYISPADNKEVNNPIVIHLTVIKEKEGFKIDSVW